MRQFLAWTTGRTLAAREAAQARATVERMAEPLARLQGLGEHATAAEREAVYLDAIAAAFGVSSLPTKPGAR